MERIKRTKTERSIQQVYLVAFILLLLSYLFTLYTNRQLLKQANFVDHSNKVIKTLDNSLSTMIDAETGVRGYILTKNIQFLFPYYGTEERSDSLLGNLQKLVSDNPVQQKRLLATRQFTRERFGMLRYHLKSFDANNRQITDSMLALQDKSKKLMDNIRENIGVMQRHESRLLEARERGLKETTSAITIITIVSLALAVGLLVFGLVTYMRVSKERRKGLAEIEEYQSRLNFRIMELDEANMELIKMRSLEKFAATGRIARTIAHEIRNPLTNINLATEQLRDEMPEKTENSGFLFDMINRNSGRINQLISDLLNSTKFTDLNYEKISVNEFVEETLKEAQDRINLKHTTVIKRFVAEPCSISIDKVKMNIALLNIIINAIEAMDNKEGSELTIETKKEGTKCKVIISDNGVGMDKDALSRIFEPYFTSKPKGNGLGLTNTQNIILNHGGEISVESVRGKGTHFIIILESVDS